MNHLTRPRGLRRRAAATSLVAALLGGLLALVPGGSLAGAENTAVEGSVAEQGTLGEGYFLVATDGGIFNFGDSEFKGSTGDISLNQPIVGAESTPTGEGYWLVAADGGIFTFGDAAFFGSTGDMRLNKPIVAMVATPTGQGYWLFATDGGVFTFGDAAFFGSTGNMALNQPIVGADITAGGFGYYLVAADGGIFAFGDAAFFGSTGGMKLNKPIVGMATTFDGMGYYLVATDGGVFTFGETPLDAPFFGSTGDMVLNEPIVGMSLSASNQGYFLAASDGGIFTFGDAEFFGSTGDMTLNKPIVGMSTTPVSPITAPDFVVNLRGSAEVPGPADTDGTGTGLLDFTDDELCYVVFADGIAQATAMHIHRAVAGVAGPVVIPLAAPDENGTAAACVAVDPALASEIMAYPQGFYLNVHNAEFPAGAIRGQLAGHLAVGVTNTNLVDLTANIVLLDTENPAGAQVLSTVPTQGAPVVGFDFRPGTVDAYLLLQSGPSSLVLVRSAIDGTSTVVNAAIPLATPSANFGMDFNPAADRIRVISGAGENLRIHPDTGAVTPDTDLSGPGNAGAAYTNNRAGAATTTLFDIDYLTDTLGMQGGADGTPSPDGGVITPVGALGVDVGPMFGFDIAPSPAGVAGTALIGGQLTGSTDSVLLAVDLATGKATKMGRIGGDGQDGIQTFAILV